jgi:hypothetical protein
LFSVFNLFRSARTHWLCFLNAHCSINEIKILKTQLESKVVTAAEQVPYDALTSLLFGSFATYLASQARVRCNPTKGLIAFKSADSYFSAIKSYYCVHLYTDLFMRPVFQKLQWAVLCAGIASICHEHAMATRTNMVNGQKAATAEDAKNWLMDKRPRLLRTPRSSDMFVFGSLILTT